MYPLQPKKSSRALERLLLIAIFVYIVIALGFIAIWYGWISLNSLIIVRAQ
jgi:hypothetical protein